MIRDPAEIQKSNVWQEAAKIKNKDSKSSILEKTFIVVGAPSSGKTSFIKVFKSDLDFETKPTNLIEYSYVKKLAVKKEIVHCYEIATKTLTEIITSLITCDNFASTIFVICVDLSQPGTAIEETMQWIKIIRNQSERFFNEKMLNRQDKHAEFREAQREDYEENEDRDMINPIPLNAIILGTKYDLFERYDTENRKWLARALRYLAHSNNAGLYFCSTKNMQVAAQLRAYLQEKIVNEKKKKIGFQVDHTKPVFVHNGQDTIKSMNLPSSGSMNTIEVLKKQLSSLFGAEETKKKEPIDLSKYGESRIDSIISEKKKVNSLFTSGIVKDCEDVAKFRKSKSKKNLKEKRK